MINPCHRLLAAAIVGGSITKILEMSTPQVLHIPEILLLTLEHLDAVADKTSLAAAARVDHVWHDAATAVLWRRPPPEALNQLSAYTVRLTRRRFYTAKVRQLSVNGITYSAMFHLLNLRSAASFMHLTEFSISSSVLRTCDFRMDLLRRLLADNQLSRFSICNCDTLVPQVMDALDLVSAHCTRLRQLRVTTNKERRTFIQLPTTDMRQRFLAFITAGLPGLTHIELSGEAGWLASAWRDPDAASEDSPAAASDSAVGGADQLLPEHRLASTLILDLAGRAELRTLVLADAVIGHASVAHLEQAMATSAKDCRAPPPFLHLQRLHVSVDPTVMPTLVALVPRIVQLRLQFCPAPGARPFFKHRRRRCAAGVRVGHILALRHLQHLRVLGIHALGDARDDDWFIVERTCVERLSAQQFAVLAQALAPRLQQLEAGPEFLPSAALSVLSAQRVLLLEHVNIAGDYDLDGLLTCDAGPPSFPQLRRLSFGGVEKDNLKIRYNYPILPPILASPCNAIPFLNWNNPPLPSIAILSAVEMLLKYSYLDELGTDRSIDRRILRPPNTYVEALSWHAPNLRHLTLTSKADFDNALEKLWLRRRQKM